MEGKPFHIELLHNEIQKRKLTNPRYSLRAFSRHLGLGPSTLSRILSNHQDLSLSATKKIIKKLRLSPDDRRLFISSVAEEKKQRALNTLTEWVSSEDVEYLSSFEETLRSSRDMIFVLDRSCRCVHTNESASRLFHLPFNQMIGKTLDQIGVEKDMARQIAVSAEMVWKSGTLCDVDHRYHLSEGLTFEISLLPVMSEEEEVLAVACHWRDITERLKVENNLHMILEGGQILSHSLDYKKSLCELAQMLNQNFADAVHIELSTEDKIVIQEGRRDLLDVFSQVFPLDMKKNPHYAEVIETGQPFLMSHLDEAAFTFSFTQAPEVGSLLCLPLQCRELCFATMILLRDIDREPFFAHDMEFGRDLALRASETIDYCLLFEKCQD